MSGLRITGYVRPSLSMERCRGFDAIFVREIGWNELQTRRRQPEVLSFARISDLDSSTNPPVGIPGFAAVKSVSDRCRIARVNRYGMSGA
jgi:hypothetical protein